MNDRSSNTIAVVAPSEITLIPNNSLLTETPEEGRQRLAQELKCFLSYAQRKFNSGVMS
jgi:hypothetical protein